jgi:nucleotide-binding universal stress UspA family protein
MKKILCAVDYSKNSVIALKYANSISKKLGANLVVTHVLDYPTIFYSEAKIPFPDLEKEAIKKHQSKLEQFCFDHVGNEKSVSVEAIEDQSVVDGIVSKAEEIHAFMIVVGMKGTSLIKELIMGSTAKALINQSPCFVLAVPENANYVQINTIVYATDFEIEEDIDVIKRLSGLAKKFDATIKVIHISTENEVTGESQLEWFKSHLKDKVDYDKITYQMISSNSIYESIITYLDEVNADLVVMLERENKGFLKKWIRQDLVKKLEIYGKIPLVSFNEKNFGPLHFLTL